MLVGTTSKEAFNALNLFDVYLPGLQVVELIYV